MYIDKNLFTYQICLEVLFLRKLTRKYTILGDPTVQISFYHMSSTRTGIKTKYKKLSKKENFV